MESVAGSQCRPIRLDLPRRLRNVTAGNALVHYRTSKDELAPIEAPPGNPGRQASALGTPGTGIHPPPRPSSGVHR
jgi:hypothetical protein